MVKEYANAGLAENWAFARKFNEILNSAGINLGDSRNNLNRLFILSSAADAKEIAKDEKKGLYSIVKAMTEGSAANQLSGANLYDGTLWFNKETSDWTLAHAFAVLVLEEKTADSSLKAFKAAVKAKEAAEYKCAEFAKAFAPAEKVKKAAKKAAKKDKAEKSEKPAKKEKKATAKKAK